ncbi:MAG: M16 family metallopeptidase [Pseudomonadota bacterium]
MRFSALLSCALALLVPATQAAESYLPPGALSYRAETLPNGLRIVRQEVRGAPYVSARLLVRTGTDNFPCADRELPHLVEHLLFSANGAREESEIDDLVADWGGQINAFTYAEQTDVTLDAHARFQAEAMRLLASMIAGFTPDEADIAREKSVVEHESGIVHDPLRLWWSAQPFTRRAGTQFGIAAGLLCAGGVTPVRHLRLADVQRAFAENYVPANMILVLAGDLSADGLAAARDAFGALPLRPRPASEPARIVMPPAGDFRSGWLSGAAQLAEPTALGITPFRDWEGYYALLLVESWLNDRLFRELRSERGLAYTPTATVQYEGPALSVSVVVQTDPADRDFVMQYLQALVDEVRNRGIPPEDFERLRMSTLLGMAQSFERISDRADYLAGSWREIDSGGLFDSERYYRDIDHRRFSALVARDWPPRFAIFDNAPRLSWQALTGMLIACLLMLATGIGLFVWRHLRRRRAMV